MAMKLNANYVKDFLSQEELAAIYPEIKAAHKVLHGGTGAGNDFLGWLNLPQITTKQSLAELRQRRSASKKAAMC